MLPAHQCFDAANLLGCQIQLWLEMQDELIFAEGPVQIFIQLQSQHFPFLHALGIELVVIAAVLLGPV